MYSFIWEITPQSFADSVKESKSYADLSRRYYGTSQNTRTVKERIKREGLDISHFTGRAKYKGQKRPENSHPHYDLDELLQKNEYKIHGDRLKDKLIATNTLFNQCYLCGLTEWQGKPLTLHLVHLNRDSYDNRINNLVLLCPNCFSQVKQGDMATLHTCECGANIPKERNTCRLCTKRTKCTKPSKQRLQKELIKTGLSQVKQKYHVDRDTIIGWINN